MENRTCTTIKFLAISALLATSMLAGLANADDSCNSKILASDANCLSSEVTGPDATGRSTYKIKNLCAKRGDVVARIEYTPSSFTNDHTERLGVSYIGAINTSPGTITGIYCCKDSSDLCNRIEICWRNFSNSAAYSSCPVVISFSESDPTCTIEAGCLTSGDGYLNITKGTFHWEKFKDLNNCNGELTLAAC